MSPNFAALETKLAAYSAREALVWQDRSYSFADLSARIADFTSQLKAAGMAGGAVVALQADFSPGGVAALLALWRIGAVAVPLTAAAGAQQVIFNDIAQSEWTLTIDSSDRPALASISRHASHELFHALRTREHPGLVLFSSGATGQAKAVLHDTESLLGKYLTPRHCYRTLAFLLFDHIGGLDTLLYSLANGSCLITLSERSPDAVCASIERHRAAVLPVSPTFLNLLLLSGAYQRYDLSALQIITYGAEVMPPATLARLEAVFPGVRLMQKFGTSEVGTLRSQSRDNGSVWVKLGGEGYQTRVVDGILQIKAESAMLGYLNASSPFTPDGWFVTGDQVEVDGEYFRVQGRACEIINVGGRKVYPAEVEEVLLQMPDVREAVVYGEKNPLLGQIVCVVAHLSAPRDRRQWTVDMRCFCRERLQEYQIPVRVRLSEEPLHGRRWKTIRSEHVH